MYGRLLKTWGAIFLGLGIFYAIFFSAVPLTSETGEVLSQSQRSSFSAMMFIFFTSIGLPMRISGKRRIKEYMTMQEINLANTAKNLEQMAYTLNYNVEQMVEQTMPRSIIECPGCGAKLKVALGTTAVCEYCGNEFNT